MTLIYLKLKLGLDQQVGNYPERLLSIRRVHDATLLILFVKFILSFLCCHVIVTYFGTPLKTR